MIQQGSVILYYLASKRKFRYNKYMKIKVLGVNSRLESIIFILAFAFAIVILGILIWKFVNPFLAIFISAIISYLFYLRKFLGKKR